MKKLVRDKIVEIIRRNGEVPEYYVADDDEYREVLCSKLFEELIEFKKAETREEKQEQIADILEVVEAIMECNGFTLDEIQQVKEEKRRYRGMFEKRIVLKIKHKEMP